MRRWPTVLVALTLSAVATGGNAQRTDEPADGISDAELSEVLDGFDHEADDAISDSELDDVLSGFDDETTATSGDGTNNSDADLDDVLAGFDDETTPATGNATADDQADADLDDVLSGFDDPNPEARSAAATTTPPGPAEPVKPTPFGGPLSRDHFSGSLSFSGVYAWVNRDPPAGSNNDARGITRLRTRLDLEYQADPLPGWRFYADGHAWYDWVYKLIDRDYPQSVENEYQQEIEIDQLWLRGRLGSAADIKLGRQIVVWGKSDNLRVTDVLNPLDARELGMVDIEDLRLPVTMSRLDLYRGDWNLSGMLIHEVRFDKLPPFGSEFFPFPGRLPPNDKPDSSIAHTQAGLALNGSFSRWDLSLYAANLYDRQPYIANAGTRRSPRPERRHARISMFGAAAVLPLGNWLLTSELAYYPGLRLTGIDQRVARSDILLGVEYSGFNDTTLSVELVDRHLYDYQPLPGGQPRNDWQAAVRYQGDFQHDRLHLTLVGTFIELFDNSAGFIRASGEYELTDDLDLRLGVVFYQQGERPPTRGLGDNDRVFMDLEWSF